ncbi:carbohydrate ABC transporter permease [Paenarthrobacter nicotinovorans]|uniref:carbohydrate ABC transporter permease n=1 Tax=Paenarthrobacter nicotinovorans TaxID=29320 RepID=UPI00382B681F
MTTTPKLGGQSPLSSQPSPIPPARTRRPRTDPANARRHNTQARTAWMFLAPFLVLFVLLTLLPVIISLTMSTTDISAKDLRDPFGVDFVGLDNFVDVLTNQTFLRSVLNTGLYVLLCVPLTMGIGLGLALILNKGIRKLRTFFRAAIYLPVITNIVAAAVIWQYAFTPSGPVNAALGAIGIQGPAWLTDPAWAFGNVVMLGVWRTVGTCMVLYLAGLQSVPEEVYEAASLDGAGRVRQLFSVTLPLLRPNTLLVSVLMTVSFLNIFEEPYLLTNGGPLGATRSIALWVYEQFGFGNTAASMAGSFLLLLLIGVASLIQFRVLRPKH